MPGSLGCKYVCLLVRRLRDRLSSTLGTRTTEFVAADKRISPIVTNVLIMTDIERTAGNGRWLPWIFIFGDFLVVNIMFALTLACFPELMDNERYIRELWLLVEVSFIPMGMVARQRQHDIRAIVMERVLSTVFLETVIFMLLFMALTAFLHIPSMAGRVYLLFGVFLFCGVGLFEIFGKLLLKRYRRQGFNFARVVVIGTGAAAKRLQANMEKDAGYGYRILAFFDDDPQEDFNLGKVLPMSELDSFVSHNMVRQIFYTLSGHDSSLPSVIRTADNNVVDFYYVPQIPRTLSRQFQLNSIGSLPVLSIRRNPLKNMFNRAVKRTFDIVVSSLFLCFYPLIYIPVAIGIKLSSPGPVYFRQLRTGYLGNSFECLKFRTMRLNNNADSCQATADDPRKTRLGNFLRRTSIDELPQFINVLKGDMSIVGPRPHMLKHTADYTQLVDRYMVRHAVKPGITGWAQVNGYRGITDQLWKMERRVEYDVWYIENWTFLLDLKIMVRTVLNAVQGEKNAF